MLKFTERTEFLIFIATICLLSSGLGGLYLKLFAMNPPAPVHVVYVPIWIGMIATILLRFRIATFGVVAALPYVAFMLLAVVSFKWSQQPTVTLREALPGLLNVVYLATICWRYSWEEIVEGIWTAMFGMVLFSFILYVAVPSIGRMSEIHVGTMSGIWTEKNSAGQIGAFGACLALARFAINPKTILSSGFSFLLFTAFLLLSTSKTSLVAYILACGGFGWVFLMRRSMPVFLVTTWLTVVVSGLAINFLRNNTDMVLGLLGRTSTFSSRANIWKSVEFSLADRPMLGHGFAGYWDDVVYGKTLAYVYDDLQFLPGHSHNSYIEVKLGLGMVGLYILLGAMVFYGVVTLLKIRRSHGAYFAIPFIFAALVIGTFEAILGNVSNFGGAVMVLVAVKMIRPVLIEETQSGIWKTVRSIGAGAQRARTVQDARPVPAARPSTAPPQHGRRAAMAEAGPQPAAAGQARQSAPQNRNYGRRATDRIEARLKGRKPHYPFRPSS